MHLYIDILALNLFRAQEYYDMVLILRFNLSPICTLLYNYLVLPQIWHHKLICMPKLQSEQDRFRVRMVLIPLVTFEPRETTKQLNSH